MSSVRKPVLFRITNNLRVGGIQRRLRSLLPLLTSEFEVHVVTYRDKGPYYDELAGLGVHTHFLPIQGKWSPSGIWKLSRLLKEHRADIVHTHSLGGNITGIIAAALAKVPVRIAQVHLTFLHWYGKSEWRRKKQIWQERLVHAWLTHRILFVSQQSRDYFQQNTHLPDSMLQIVHNGIDLSLLKKSPPVPQDIKPFQDKILVGFVGRLAKGKGVEFFVDFAHRICSEKPDRFRFVLIGGGQHLPSLKKRIRSLGMDKYIHVLGEKDNIFDYYAHLDLLLFPSEEGVEGMPGVALEAAFFGLPILARRTAPLEEIQEYYSRIQFIEPEEDPLYTLEAALDMEPADMTKLHAEFSIQAMLDRTRSIYHHMLPRQQS